MRRAEFEAHAADPEFAAAHEEQRRLEEQHQAAQPSQEDATGVEADAGDLFGDY